MVRVLALFVALATTAAAQAAAPDFHVIVNRSSQVVSLSRAEVSAIFMRRAPQWMPVDQAPASHVREHFSRAIHGKSVAYVIRYWQRLIFAGRALPPPEVRSDAAVVEFVKKHPSAIGYIASEPPADVKVIAVTP